MPRLLPRRRSPRQGLTARQLRNWEQRYAAGEERPLGSYAGLLLTYAGLAAGLIATGRARGVELPERVPTADLTLLAIGTFRAARLVTKDSVTAVARAPFTRFEGPGAPGEVQEEVIGTGPRHAIGELLSCPFCISVWLATVGAFGMVAFPRQARMVCSVLGVSAASDALQLGYGALHRAAE